MKVTRRPGFGSDARRNGDQYRAQQLLKNTVIVEADGSVYTTNPALYDAVEVFYNAALERFVGRPRRGIHGITVRSK